MWCVLDSAVYLRVVWGVCGVHKYVCDVCGVVCVVYIRVHRAHVCGMWVCVFVYVCVLK